MGDLVEIELPSELLARAHGYAAKRGRSLSALIQEFLMTVTSDPDLSVSADPLGLYCRGVLDRADAMRRLNVNDYGELVAALERANLPLSRLQKTEGGRRKPVVVKLVGGA